MCGIIGYTGPKELVTVLLEGLSALEYRGYDSAGIALPDGSSFRVLRRAGKLGELKEHIASLHLPPFRDAWGIGHTRWATHGRPNERNAHPHRDCTGRVILVHNGIIENFAELKAELSSQGHRFVTETDSEVIAHLIESEFADGTDLADSVRRSVPRLHGAFSIVCVSPASPGLIVAARSGPPLVVGFGDSEGFVASDIPALLPHTRDIAALGDGEIAIVTRERQRIVRFDGTEVAPARQRITWDVEAAQKAGYPHYMLKEIVEQPEALRATLLHLVSPARDEVLLPDDDAFRRRLQSIERVALCACGTSWHAALVGRHYVERLARLPASVDISSEFRYSEPVLHDRTLAVFITQSGETADTLAALREARRLGALTLAITNVQGSMATREADATLLTKAGPEIGVASTKTFTAQIVTTYLLALSLGKARGVLRDVPRRLEELLTLPHLVQSGLRLLESGLASLAASFASSPAFFFIGRGLAFPIALEGALKLKEISYIHAEGYAAGELKHGPIALIDEHVPVVALAPPGRLKEKVLSNVQEVSARGGVVIAVGEEGDEALRRSAPHVVEIPRSPELLSPVLLAIPMQLFAYHVAVARGCDVDQPRNLAKSVTVE